MSDTTTNLFSNGYLSTTLRLCETRVREKVDAITADQLLSLSEDQVVAHVVSDLTIEPLTIYEDQKEMESIETQIDVSSDPRRVISPSRGAVFVPGHEVRISIPFTGDIYLWSLTPDSYRPASRLGTLKPEALGRPGALVIVITQPADEPAAAEIIKSQLEATCEDVRFHLRAQKVQIDAFNAQLPQLTRQLVVARKQRLAAQQGIQKHLGIPLKRRDGVPSVEPVQLKRQLVRPLPSVPKGGFQPEPGITDEDYAHILNVIRHEGRTFETTPKTFAKLEEEELRNLIVAHLNGHYEGLASGETFRGIGKTDIRIEEKSRAAFVAECKVWHGSAELKTAIDQLLGYLTWRDCKTALIIFNKDNAKFSELIEKIPATMQAHRNFRRKGNDPGLGEWRFTFSSSQDEAREIVVTAFVFNLFLKNCTRPGR